MARKDKSDAAIEREQEERATKALVRYEKKAYDRKQLHLDIQNLTKRTMVWLHGGGTVRGVVGGVEDSGYCGDDGDFNG